MKLRNIFTMLAAALCLTFVGCEEQEQFLDEVKVSKSFIAIPVEGGSVKISVDAAADWTITAWDAENATDMEMPEWLTVDPVSGSKGKSEVTFTAAETTVTNDVVLHLNCDGACQVLKVYQEAEKVETPLSTCKDVLEGGEVDKFYKIKGVVAEIPLADFQKYGKFYISDDSTSEKVQIYGCANKSQYLDGSNNPTIAVGDVVTIEGSWSKYGNFNNDTQILEVEKSLIKIEKVSPATALSKDGDVFTVTLTNKGEGLEIAIPEADQTWITAGEPLVLGTATLVEFTAAANEGGARKTTITFSTTSAGKSYAASADIEQLGNISEVSVADFLAAEVGTALYKLTGKVTKLKTGDYGNFHLEDATGSVYVYGLTATPQSSNDKSFPTLGIKEGDVVTLIGTRAQYANAKDPAEKEQVGGPAYYVSHIGSTEISVADFKAKSKSADVWYSLTGTIKEIVKADYGNFYLEDETGYVYVYGLTKAPVAKNDKTFESLGLQAGDKITIVGTRDEYASSKVEDQKIQVGGPAYFIKKHETPASDDSEATL